MSIRLRVFLAFIVLVGTGVGYLLSWTVRELKPEFREALEEPLVDIAEVLAAEIGADINGTLIDPARVSAAMERAKARDLKAKIYSREKSKVDLQIAVIDRGGKLLYDSTGVAPGTDYSKWNDVDRTLRGEYGARTTRTNEDDADSSILFVAAPILSGGEIVGAVSVGKPAKANNHLIERVRRRIWLGGAITLAGAIILALLVTTWVSWPVRRLTGYARDVVAGLRPPLPKVGGGEMQIMRDSFEEMRVALEGKAYVERYVQGLTHELKSPIAAIQGAAALLQEDLPPADRRKFSANILREAERTRRTIDEMLVLATIERMDGLVNSGPIELADVVADAITAATDRAEQRGVSVEFKSSESSRIIGNRSLIEQAVSNVLSNAIDFSRSGSKIQFEISKLDSNPNQIAVTCLDSGAGIPDYAFPRLFERFYSLARPETGEKSSGLGLSIVKEVLELHNGKVEITSRPEGGTKVVLTFPAAQ